MEEYIKQLKATYENELYYFSLIGCMTLIDTCAALNSTTGKTNKTLFKKWYEDYLPQYLQRNLNEAISFSADECYKFRCRLLHQGRTEIDADSMNYSLKSGKIAFRIGAGTFHCCNFEGTFYLDIKMFMDDVISGVLKWIEDTKTDNNVILNKSRMIKISNVSPSGNRPGTYIC